MLACCAVDLQVCYVAAIHCIKSSISSVVKSSFVWILSDVQTKSDFDSGRVSSDTDTVEEASEWTKIAKAIKASARVA